METTTFAFFALLGVYAFLRGWQRGSTAVFAGAAVSLAVATLLRPEGTILFGFVGGLALLTLASGSRRSLSGLVILAGTYGALVSAFFLWRYQVFGEWFPNTYYAKTGGSLWQYLRGVKYVAYFSVFYLTPLLPLVILGVWNSGTSRLRVVSPHDFGAMVEEHLPVVAVAGLSVTYLAFIVYAGGDYMAMYRFVVPVLPFIYLSLATHLHATVAAVGRGRGPMVALTMAAALAVGGLGVLSTPLEEALFAAPRRQHGHHRGIETERWHVARLTLIGKFFDGYKRHADETLATRAIGAIGWHARMKIDDLTGLADRHIARVQVADLGLGWAGHEKLDIDYSFRRLPTFVDLDRTLAQTDIAGLTRTTLEMADALEAHYPRARIFTPWIRRNQEFVEEHYRLKTVWLDDRVNGEAGFFAFLERKHREAPAAQRLPVGGTGSPD